MATGDPKTYHDGYTDGMRNAQPLDLRPVPVSQPSQTAVEVAQAIFSPESTQRIIDGMAPTANAAALIQAYGERVRAEALEVDWRTWVDRLEYWCRTHPIKGAQEDGKAARAALKGKDNANDNSKEQRAKAV